MNRYEFIDEMRRMLSENLPSDEIRGHIAYYEDYIDMQIKKGVSEESVIQSLGNPRLIAKSIVDAQAGKHSNDRVYRANDTSDKRCGGEKWKVNINKNKISFWLGIILSVLILLIVIGFLFSALAVLLRLFFPVILVVMIFKIINNLRR